MDEKRILFINKFTKLLTKEKAELLEDNIFHKIYNIACRDKIKLFWDNYKFYSLYVNECIRIYDNMKLNKLLCDDYDKLHLYNDLELNNKMEIYNKKNYIEYDIKISNEITCFKCKLNQVFIVSKQKRCIDEGMSFIYTCKNCGNSWSEN